MPVGTAVNHFLGKEGCKRMNCAQAVLYAFKDKCGLGEEVLEVYKGYGSGMAPGGLCGAVFAAKHILGQADIAKVKDFEAYFLQHAGALNCRDIRSRKKLSCVKCVEQSSKFIAGNVFVEKD